MSISRELGPLLRASFDAEQQAAWEALPELADRARTWPEFCELLIRHLVSSLDAVSGMVWTVSAPGQLRILRSVGADLKTLSSADDAEHEHQQLADHLLALGETIALLPHCKAPGHATVGNPTDFALLFGIARTEFVPFAVFELFLAHDASEDTVRQAIRFLKKACEFATHIFTRQSQQDLEARQEMWAKLETFCHAVHRGLDSTATCYAIANEGRRLLECDRVVVALWNGRECRLVAINGKETIDQRANQVRLLGNLATTVARVGEPLWYAGDPDNLAPQVEAAVDEYLDLSHSKVVVALPLVKPAPPASADPKASAPEIVGMLIVEQIENARMDSGLRERAELVARHAGEALANSVEHESLFLLPVWRTIGKSRWLVRARTLPKTMLVLTFLAASIGTLFLIHSDFDVESKGLLEPIVRQDIFAPQDGVIQSLFVKHGQTVAQGTPLLSMTNTDMNFSLTELKGKLAAVNEQLRTIEQQRAQIHVTQEERDRLAGQAAQLHASCRSLDRQVALLAEKQQQLEVASPIAGQVVTWQLRDKLINRPVQRGQVLLSVADPNDEWQLELHLPEDRMGEVEQAQRDIRAGEMLPVQYILSTNPQQVHHGTVQEIHTTAEVRGEEGNTILVNVRIHKDDLTPGELHAGASVTAKIHCGRATLGYCWFHDVINFFHRLWFKL